MDVYHSPVIYMTADQNKELLILSIYLGNALCSTCKTGKKGRLLQNPAGRKVGRGRMKKEHIYIHILKIGHCFLFFILYQDVGK